MDNNSHIVRRDEAYYPTGSGFGGFNEEQTHWFMENSTRIYHPVYDPEPVKKKPGVWATFFTWALTTLGLAGS